MLFLYQCTMKNTYISTIILQNTWSHMYYGKRHVVEFIPPLPLYERNYSNNTAMHLTTVASYNCLHFSTIIYTNGWIADRPCLSERKCVQAFMPCLSELMCVQTFMPCLSALMCVQSFKYVWGLRIMWRAKRTNESGCFVSSSSIVRILKQSPLNIPVS